MKLGFTIISDGLTCKRFELNVIRPISLPFDTVYSSFGGQPVASSTS